MLRAAAWANNHHAETAAALKEYTPLTDDAIAKMTRIRFAAGYTPTLLQPVLDAGFKVRVSSKSAIVAGDLMFPGFS